LLEEICPTAVEVLEANEGKGSDNMTLMVVDLLWPDSANAINSTYRDFCEGTLEIQVVEADLKRSANFLQTMSPHCEIVFDGNTNQTSRHTGGGKQPKWDSKFSLPVTDPRADCTIRVYNGTS